MTRDVAYHTEMILKHLEPRFSTDCSGKEVFLTHFPLIRIQLSPGSIKGSKCRSSNCPYDQQIECGTYRLALEPGIRAKIDYYHVDCLEGLLDLKSPQVIEHVRPEERWSGDYGCANVLDQGALRCIKRWFAQGEETNEEVKGKGSKKVEIETLFKALESRQGRRKNVIGPNIQMAFRGLGKLKAADEIEDRRIWGDPSSSDDDKDDKKSKKVKVTPLEESSQKTEPTLKTDDVKTSGKPAVGSTT